MRLIRDEVSKNAKSFGPQDDALKIGREFAESPRLARVGIITFLWQTESKRDP